MAITKGQIGSKFYNIETAELVDDLPNGFQVYRKRGRSSAQCFLYYPKGQTIKECFFPLSPTDSEKYLPTKNEGQKVKIEFTDRDRDRIKRHAWRENMSMAAFLLMLVDRYEAEHKDRG